jgi:hypothetical protein
MPRRRASDSQLGFDFTPKPKPAPKPAVHPGAPGAPGAGWQPIPNGKHGGFRKRQGSKWIYWYPDKPGAVSPKPRGESSPKPSPKLVVKPSSGWTKTADGYELDAKQGKATLSKEGRRWVFDYAGQRREMPSAGSFDHAEGLIKQIDADAAKPDPKAPSDVEGLTNEDREKMTAAQVESRQALSTSTDGYKGGLLKPGQSLKKAEDAIRSAKVEHFAIFGMGEMVYRQRGSKRQVQVPPEAVREMATDRMMSATHNHPNGSFFSTADFYFAAQADLKEFRACSPEGGAYVMRRGPNGWPSRAEIKKAMRSIGQKATKRAKNEARSELKRRGCEFYTYSDPIYRDVMGGLTERLGELWTSEINARFPRQITVSWED